MIRRFLSVLFASVLLAGMSAPAWGQSETERGDSSPGHDHRDGHGGQGGGKGRGLPSGGNRRWVPEFDVTTAGAIAVVVAGGGLLVARRRKR